MPAETTVIHEAASQFAGVLRVMAGVIGSLVTISGGMAIVIAKSKTAREKWHSVIAIPSRLERVEKEFTTNSGSTVKDQIRLIGLAVEVIDQRTKLMRSLTVSIIENDKDIAVYLDETGKVTCVSAGYTALTGLDTNGAANGGWKRSVHVDDLKDVEDGWKNAREKQELFVAEYRKQHAFHKGPATPVRVTASPMRDEFGKFVGYASRIELLDDPAGLMPKVGMNPALKEHTNGRHDEITLPA